MEPRIFSHVSETWGHGTVYTYDPKIVEETKASVIALRRVISSKTRASELKIPQPVTNLEPTEKTIPYFLSSLFAVVLEDVLAQTWILERCNNEMSVTKTLSEIDYLKAIKYGVYDRNEVKDELDGIDVRNLNCLIYKIKKLDADRKYLNNVMVATYLALAKTCTFQPLVSFINEIEERDRFLLALETEESKNKALRKDLSKQVRQQHNHIKTVLYDTDVSIDKLRTQVEDSILYSEVRGRYIDNWQLARTEQHTQTIFDTENDPASSIEYYKQRSDHELRIHIEVETLVSIVITEMLAKIEEWMVKYDQDIEKKDLEIQIKKNEYQDMRDKRIKLEETLVRHEMKMKNWINFKEEREKARLYREKMTTSAIIVQAWWRGLLVRRELGPFKIKKAKKDSKKK